ncbi:MAG: hypothetical protein ACJAT2_003232 [Bacteriovoracaceae bacterium]|jgi:hypothetical protein
MEDLLLSQKKDRFKKARKKIIDSSVSKLKSMSLKAKLKFLQTLNARRGRFKGFSEMYANTINKMLHEGLISAEEVPALLKNEKKLKYGFDFTYGEVRVSPSSWDGLPNLDETMDQVLDRLNPSADQVMRLRKLLEESDFNPEELQEFNRYFSRFPETDDDWKILKEYLSYATAMRSKNQMAALREMPGLFFKENKAKHLRKFRKIRSSIDNYEVKQVKKLEKKALKKGATKAEAKEIARREAKEMTELYSNLKYSCRSTKPTAESKQAAKSTSKFFMGMGISATAGTYAYANWDKDKTKFDWYGKLGHDLAWKFIFQYGYNAVMTDQAATFLKKNLSLHIFYTPADYIEAAMYEKEFGEENSFLTEEYERMLEARKLEDPAFVEEYNKMMSSLNNEYFFEKVKRYSKDLFTGEESLPKNEFDEILSLEDISVGDLEDEEMKERLMEAVTLKLYDENSGNVKLGSHTLDRYLFVRTYDVVDVPKSLLMGLWIYKTMCMGGMNMKAAITQASIIYAIDQVVGKFIYYQIRRDAINM